MRVLTGQEMRVGETALLKKLGIPSLLLMENAGNGIVEVLEQRFAPLQNKKIHILAGAGNNGGDGLVVARQLLTKKARPKIYFVGDSSKLSPEARINLEVLRKLGAEFFPMEEWRAAQLRFSLNLADVIVDALLGTGFRGELREELADLVNVVNEIQRPKVSVDLPTGVEADTGKVGNTAIRACITVNLGALKVGCLLYPGRAYSGENVVADLGFPLKFVLDSNRCLADDQVLDFLPKRQAWGHKGTFGHALVVAGSRNMAGAAALCGQAVLRGGAGLATLAVPDCIADRFKPDELLLCPVPATAEGAFGEMSLPELQLLSAGKDVLIIGPGLSAGTSAGSVVRQLLSSWQGPAVIDADALRVLDEKFLTSIPPAQRRQWVLTPHPGEMGRMLGKSAQLVNENRLETGEAYAKKWGLVLVLKGAPTVTFSAGKTYINSTGSHALATGGSGDVLTGLIGALLSQGMRPLEAAAAGVFVHGRAGDLAGKEGRRGLLAGDCLKKIQKILG